MALYENQIVTGAVVDHMHETIDPRTGLQRTREIIRRGFIERVDQAPSGRTEVYVRFAKDLEPEMVPASELTLYRAAVAKVRSEEEEAPVFSERKSAEEKARKPVLEDRMGLTRKEPKPAKG